MLTQAEADALLRMGKVYNGPPTIALEAGDSEVYELIGDDTRETFVLDVSRGRINFQKVKYQHRVRIAVGLARLDLNAAPHTNPDGTVVSGRHLHVYREGYGLKWAYDLDPAMFPDPDDIGGCFARFCHYCSIRRYPLFQETIL